MLALARKSNESIMLGNDIEITVLEIKGYVRRDPGRRVALNIAKK